MKGVAYLLFSIIFWYSCSGLKPFVPDAAPSVPDYSDVAAWAALPDRKDAADETPADSIPDLQSQAEVDVFFVHPTIYWEKSEKKWNASLDDAGLNQEIDASTIRYQASAFNGAARVYAPRYRQAHLRSFFTTDKKSADQAFELAYQDVKAAFQYYLAHYNRGRPFFIASHSQGTRHAVRLMRELVDGQNLRNRLVAAYLIGWPVPKNAFKNIPPCESAEQTGCVCSWRSSRYGYTPPGYVLGDTINVTNPLTWKTTEDPAAASLNQGTLLRNFHKIYPGITDAQVHNGMLWVHKPKFPGSIFFNRKNYHIADYNLFYMNLRRNAQYRVHLFWKY